MDIKQCIKRPDKFRYLVFNGDFNELSEFTRGNANEYPKGVFYIRNQIFTEHAHIGDYIVENDGSYYCYPTEVFNNLYKEFE